MLCLRRQFFVTLALCIASAAARADEVVFTRQILPILAGKCFTCHGPDAAERQADLRLDIADQAMRELESGSVPIVPGSPTDSELVRRILSTDRSSDADQQSRLEAMKQELNGWMRSVVRSINGRDYERGATK